MLNYNQALPEQKSYQDLQMKEIKPIMKLIFNRHTLNLFGKNASKLVKSLTLHLTEQKRCTYLGQKKDL